jgi:hypothetical protein
VSTGVAGKIFEGIEPIDEETRDQVLRNGDSSLAASQLRAAGRR